MSRFIKMTKAYMDECRADFEKALSIAKLSDGKLSFTKTFTSGNQKAKVSFTSTAWAKMVILINEFDKEVAWHGVAHRLGEADGEAVSAGGEREYIITDILVYPQEVSSATVEMDTEKYATWLMENDGDERFNNIRMQGHSHVRMAPTPSGVDLNHQEEILNMLGDDDFYIFMIWNKSFVSNIKIYDMRENTLFENGDVSVSVLDEVGSLDEFLSNAKAMVKDRVYTKPPYSGVTSQIGATSATTPCFQTQSTYATPKYDNQKPRTRIGAGWYGRNADKQVFPSFDAYDDDGDPYSLLQR